MKGRALIIAIAATPLLFGCQPKEPATSTLIVPAVEQCKASGGKIEKVGIVGTPACVIPTADAGKTCSDSSECQGRCLVEDWEGDRPPRIGTQSKGMCEASNLTFGCIAEVRRGRIATAFVCVD